MNEQRIGEAVIADFSCEKCYDTGIQTGHAEMDGQRVVVQRVCECQKPKSEEPKVVYDHE